MSNSNKQKPLAQVKDNTVGNNSNKDRLAAKGTLASAKVLEQQKLDSGDYKYVTEIGPGGIKSRILKKIR